MAEICRRSNEAGGVRRTAGCELMILVYRYYTTVGIIVVCALVFALEQSRGTDYADDYGAVPVAIHQAWEGLRHGAINVATLHGLSRLVTAIFLHADFEHILYNMVFMWPFACLASQFLGRWWMLAVFLITGICGNLLQVCLKLDSPAPIIGASGAISGLAGLYLGLALRWDLPWPDMWPLAHPIPPLQLAAFAAVGFVGDIYFLASRDVTRHIAFGAHIGGFLSGLAIAALITTLYPTNTAWWRTRRRR
jgi:membrane associated rhomboid family serine protease